MVIVVVAAIIVCLMFSFMCVRCFDLTGVWVPECVVWCFGLRCGVFIVGD